MTALVFALILLALSAIPANAQQPTFYVATTGSNTTGDGSLGNPWATIRKALNNVPDGSLVLVRPGTYTGVTRLVGNFVQGVTIRSEVPYRAQLRNTDRVINTNDCNPCRGITIEGFDIAHSGPGAGSGSSAARWMPASPCSPGARRSWTTRRPSPGPESAFTPRR